MKIRYVRNVYRYFLLQDAENRQKVPMVAEVTMDDDFVDSSDEERL